MKIALLGAGHIGHTIASLLQESGDYQVTVFDRAPHGLARIASLGLQARQLDLSDGEALRRAVAGSDALLNALPYTLATTVATAAKAVHAHYFDLTEDVQATHAIRALAAGAPTAFMPQCGLAPGFIGIAARALVERFDAVREVKMRVGALPEFPTNALKYNLTWSLDGLINEYCRPCEAIRAGRVQQLQPLEGLEHFSLDGVEYEAFNTSGGLGTLCETLAGRVETLDYKSVRYPGHCNLVKFLLEDLRLASDPATLKAILRRAVPGTQQDVVLIVVAVTGRRGDAWVQEVFQRKIFARQAGDRHIGAIQTATAAGVCAVLDLLRQQRLPQRGFIRQEQVALDEFLANRFGRLYQGTPVPEECAA